MRSCSCIPAGPRATPAGRRSRTRDAPRCARSCRRRHRGPSDVAEKDKEQVHYIHRLNYTARERLVGVFVLTSILLLFLMLVFSKDAARLFAKKFTLHAYITNAQGVSTDTHVFV